MIIAARKGYLEIVDTLIKINSDVILHKT
ncbi:hypothetical protein [Spiroplasma endosymbiont of Danaus chrysippus]